MHMELKTVLFEIVSLDSKTKFKTDGEFKNSRLKFVDPDGDLNYVVCKDHLIEYYKKGNIDMKYIFNLDQVTKGYYGIQGNRFEFQIVTHILTIDEDEIFVKYDLYQGEDLINKTELRVGYQNKEES